MCDARLPLLHLLNCLHSPSVVVFYLEQFLLDGELLLLQVAQTLDVCVVYPPAHEFSLYILVPQNPTDIRKLITQYGPAGQRV